MTGRPRRGALFVELLVVVLGVLIALAADSWWTDRSERARVAGYLVALETDMTSAAADLDVATRRFEEYARDVFEFREVVESSTPAPDTTTVPYHTLDGGERFFLPTGMLEALLTTGDINLLPGPLRMTIIREYAELTSRQLQFERWNDLLLESARDLFLPQQEMVVAGEVEGRQLSGREIQANPRVRYAWLSFLTVFINQSEELAGMHRNVEAILEAVGASAPD